VPELLRAASRTERRCCFLVQSALLSIRAGWATISIEVPHQLLVAPVYLVHVAVDLVLGVAAPAPPFAFGAAELHVPVALALLVPADGLCQDRAAVRAAMHAICRLLLPLESHAFLRLFGRSVAYTQRQRASASNGYGWRRVEPYATRARVALSEKEWVDAVDAGTYSDSPAASRASSGQGAILGADVRAKHGSPASGVRGVGAGQLQHDR
jgi:hypothetical protein